MYCRMHPTRSGVCTCSQCGDWLCEECATEIHGRIYCKTCAPKEFSPVPPPSSSFGAVRPTRYISWAVLFFFSFFPTGINYMYEGLIKRGLFALCSFFTLCYLTSVLGSPLFGMMIPILLITCIFDSFQIRRRINAGEAVPDNVDDILSFVKRNKAALILFAVVVVGLSVLSGISNFLMASLHLIGIPRFVKPLMPLAILVFGLYFIIRATKHKPEETYKDLRPTDKEDRENH